MSDYTAVIGYRLYMRYMHGIVTMSLGVIIMYYDVMNMKSNKVPPMIKL